MTKGSNLLVKSSVHILCLLPALRLVYDSISEDLGANPIERVIHRTGTWALALLCISLSITPLRYIKQLNWTIRLRRMLGLYSFFYALAHFTVYLSIDQGFDWRSIGKDIAKRPYVTIGFAAFLMLLPLALTSTKAAIRFLTGQRWNLLHRLVYPALICAVFHYWWLVKKDITTPALYAIVAAALLGVRLAGMLWRTKRSSSDKRPNVQASV